MTAKGEKIMRAMQAEYGKKKGKSVFYASANKGSMPPLVPAMMLSVPVGAMESRVALRTCSPVAA